MKILVASNSFYMQQDKIKFIMNNFSLNKIYSLDIYEDIETIKKIVKYNLLENEDLYLINVEQISKINDSDLEIILNSSSKNYICFITKDMSLKNIIKLQKSCSFEYISMLNSYTEKFEYLTTYINTKNIKLLLNETKYLFNLCANDIDLAINELNKLNSYYLDEEITTEKIDLFVKDLRTDSLFDFYKYIFSNNYYEKIKLVNYFTSNMQIIPLFNGVKSYVFLAYQIKIFLNQSYSITQIAKKVNKHEYYVKNIVDQIKRVQIKDIEIYCDKLAKIDLELKKDKFELKKCMYDLINFY